MTLKKKGAPDPGQLNREDFFRLDSQPNEQERLLAVATHDHAQKLHPRAANAYGEQVTDLSNFSEIGEMWFLGFLASSLLTMHGGMDACYVSQA